MCDCDLDPLDDAGNLLAAQSVGFSLELLDLFL